MSEAAAAAAAAPASPTRIQHEIRLPSKITDVTVFESSAQIRRVITAPTMPRGEVSVVFADLPQNLDRDNVQVAVRHGSNGQDAAATNSACSLRGISFKTETITVAEAAPTEERKELTARIAKLKEDLTEAQARVLAAKEHGQFFRDCASSALNGTRPEEAARDAKSSDVFTSIDAWKAMLTSTAAEDATALAEQRQHEARITEINKLIAVAQRELNDRGGSARTTTKNVVVVVLKVDKELSDVDVRLSYVVTSAKWTPEYDVRFDPEKREAKVTYNAVVVNTGAESWPDVTLTISTARPTISGKPADLTPWRASIYVPPPVVYNRRQQEKKSSMALFGSVARSAAPVCASAAMDEDDGECEYAAGAAADVDLSHFDAPQVQTAKVQEGATAMSFVIDSHAYTVGNDGKAVRVTLAVVPVKSEVTYICRPKLTETVFAKMKSTNISEFTLLPGPALVFAGVKGQEQFISKTAIDRVAPGSSFDVSLGADNDVTVKYRRLKTERGESGGGLLSAKKVKITVKTQIKVHNRKKVEIQLLLEDQIPVSQHGDIEVTMVSPTPPDKDKDKAAFDKFNNEGVVQFDMKLAAQQEKDVPIEFVVKHPQDFDMQGL